MLLLGGHISIAGGIHRAVEEGERIGCQAIQIFTKNQRTFNVRPVDPETARLFRERLAASSVRMAVSHDSYLINLAGSDPDNLAKSEALFRVELDNAHLLGLPSIITHPGSHLGRGEKAGIGDYSARMRSLLQDGHGEGVVVLLETTAGQGTNLGHRFEHLRDMLDLIGLPDRTGVCLDTAHVFAAGYDLKDDPDGVLAEFDRVIGLSMLKAVHLNDSRPVRGERKDRHAMLGQGSIGMTAFRRLVRNPKLAGLPGILETPEAEAGYPRELAALRSPEGEGET